MATCCFTKARGPATYESMKKSRIHIVIHVLLCIAINVVVTFFGAGGIYAQICIAALTFAWFDNLFWLWQTPTNEEEDEEGFRVPLVPFVPGLAVLVNVALIFQLKWMTWLRFFVWMTLGFAMYFGYGIRYSTEGYQQIRDENNSSSDAK